MLYARIDPSNSAPHQIMMVYSGSAVIDGDDIIEVPDTVQVTAESWYDPSTGDFIDPPAAAPLPATVRRARAITAIDTKAGAVRTAFASSGAFVDAEYEQALASAQQWTEAGRPDDAVPDDVQAWADATGNTAEWAADDILNTAAQWRAALTAIRRVRLIGKEAIRQAPDDADFDALAAEYLEQLEQIAAAVPTDT